MATFHFAAYPPPPVYGPAFHSPPTTTKNKTKPTGVFTGYHSRPTELDVLLHYQSVVRCQILQLNPRPDDKKNSILIFKEKKKKNDRVLCFAYQLFCLVNNSMILKKNKNKTKKKQNKKQNKKKTLVGGGRIWSPDL